MSKPESTTINMDEQQILIVPDTHGKDFWRVPVNSQPSMRVIFLGDYLDPYEDEPVEWYDVVQRFQDIITLKRSFPDWVTLLLGNHEAHYLFGSRSQRGSRYDSHKADNYYCILNDNFDCFNYAHELEMGGNKYMFSHAGINKQWLEANKKVFGDYKTINTQVINSLKHNSNFIEALSNVSHFRGGICDAGSMIWADCHEFESPESELTGGYIQIFGHTRQVGGIWQNGRGTAYCLDCGKVFVLDNNGLTEL